ncbi:MAG TPA: outer membrane protein assembly factor BamD [Gammaproteobacteria bacterium]|nr:outer membrane protein assembly factor BamD [Gammaproteobacteria bacterium]
MKTSIAKLSPFASLSRSAILMSAVLSMMLTACGGDDAIQEIGAAQLYEQGAEQLRANNYAGAIVNFRNLSIRYPFAPQARQAQLDLLFAFYRAGQYVEAIDIAETFVRENPRLPEVAYCLYMMGMIYFDKEPNILERLFRVDITERPPKETYLAFSAFQDLIRQFPDSVYVADARQRMIYLRNRLAIYENHVARYYLQRGAYVAAMQRAKFAIENYPGSPELEETLTLLIEAYDSLGMRDLADDTRRVLQQNFGDSSGDDPSDA